MGIDAERLVIRALCMGTPQGSVKDAVISLLANYHWGSQLHQVIFEAIESVPSDDPANIRQVLPAKLTRLGFPDVEWEELFEGHSLSKDEIMIVVRQMVADL